MKISYKKIVAFLSLSSYWLTASTVNKDNVRTVMYQKGQRLSLKYKRYTFWDNLVEPFIISQFGLFFGIGHSFIKGMISDNDIKIDDELDNVVQKIISE